MLLWSFRQTELWIRPDNEHWFAQYVFVCIISFISWRRMINRVCCMSNDYSSNYLHFRQLFNVELHLRWSMFMMYHRNYDQESPEILHVNGKMIKRKSVKRPSKGFYLQSHLSNVVKMNQAWARIVQEYCIKHAPGTNSPTYINTCSTSMSFSMFYKGLNSWIEPGIKTNLRKRRKLRHSKFETLPSICSITAQILGMAETRFLRPRRIRTVLCSSKQTWCYYCRVGRWGIHCACELEIIVWKEGKWWRRKICLLYRRR